MDVWIRECRGTCDKYPSFRFLTDEKTLNQRSKRCTSRQKCIAEIVEEIFCQHQTSERRCRKNVIVLSPSAAGHKMKVASDSKMLDAL